MIPEFIHDSSCPFGILPPGIHTASLDEMEERFCWNNHRSRLFDGLRAAAANLQQAGCTRLYIDGSFVSDKDYPSDFDGCWSPIGVSGNLLDPVLLDFDNGRAAQKKKYGGELFISSSRAVRDSDIVFFDFFQRDKHSGAKKGLIEIQLDQDR